MKGLHGFYRKEWGNERLTSVEQDASAELHALG